ncbi:MAG: polymer-forming cytoskeletal protein [Spirochaetales bacterium]|nr:polymer-forming cytoskeletal protein [Spirochaetales bacterium]MBP7265029.1 polymer-forming cytoskeletal protein [Spirochaetia bacterium]
MSAPRDLRVNTILGTDSSFQGDLVIDGYTRVDGEVRGSIRTTGEVVITSSARCEASVTARSAMIGGVVKGDVCVTERLTILDGGVIVGNVFAPRLDADADIIIHGDIEVSGSTEGAEEAMLAFLKRHDSGLRPMGFDRRPGGSGDRWQR